MGGKRPQVVPPPVALVPAGRVTVRQGGAGPLTAPAGQDRLVTAVPSAAAAQAGQATSRPGTDRRAAPVSSGDDGWWAG